MIPTVPYPHPRSRTLPFKFCDKRVFTKNKLPLSTALLEKTPESEINEISKAFLETLINATKKDVVIYSNSYSARTIFSSELAIYPLWVANYGVSEPRWQR